MFEAQITQSKGFEDTPTYYCFLPNIGQYITPFGSSEEPHHYKSVVRLNDDLRDYYKHIHNRQTVDFDEIIVGSMFVYNGCYNLLKEKFDK